MTPTEVDVENRRPGTKTSVSVETEIVRVEVRNERQGTNNDAETSVQKRLLGRLVSRNIRHKVSVTYRSRHVPTGGLGRITYKRQILRARTAEGVNVR